jgi:hypothetical protein
MNARSYPSNGVMSFRSTGLKYSTTLALILLLFLGLIGASLASHSGRPPLAAS